MASSPTASAPAHKAPGHLRRQWNPALFERLLAYDDRIDDAQVAEPFATLANPNPLRQLNGSTPQ